jgi:5-aminopentanamidase
MIIDPFGEIIAECRKLGNDFITATLTPEKMEQAGGYRYTMARRPELYRDIIGKEHESRQKVAWLGE